MKFKQHRLSGIAALLIAGLVMAKGAHSATEIKGDLLEFTPASGTQVLNVRPDAFYNLTMGYRGWTHHSGWGYVKLKKGKAVTITAYTDVVGLHPGIAVWYTPQGKKYAPINYANDHFYNQWENIFVKNAKDDTSDEIVGNMKMEFITNGFDRDGMGDSIPGEYDQSFVNRILDGVVGKVSVTFTPPATGYYKFVVGGINPDGAMAVAPGLTTKQPVAVDINFPQ